MNRKPVTRRRGTTRKVTKPVVTTDSRQPTILSCWAAKVVQPDQPEIIFIEEPDIRLDPAIHLIQDVFRIILQNLENDLSQLIKLRAVSPQWAFEVEEFLKSKHSLMLFSNAQMVKSYLNRLNDHGLREDEFYKLQKTKPDELIRFCANNSNSSSESRGTHLPSLMPNVNKLIIIDNGDMNLDLKSILTQWASSLTSLVIFTSFKNCTDLKQSKFNFSKPISRMTNLTRLEMYGDWNFYCRFRDDLIDVKRMAEVLGQLEHFVVVGAIAKNPKFNYFKQVKQRLAALTPICIKHLGFYGLQENSFAMLFQNWEQGKIVAASLKRLQLGRTTEKMLRVVAEQFQGLQYLSFRPINLKLLETFEILAPLKELVHLQLNYNDNGKGPGDEIIKHRCLLPTMPSVRRLDITCLFSSLVHHFSANFSEIIHATFPSLQELNLSDFRLSRLNANYRQLEGQFDALPRKRFSWCTDSHDYFPERLWSRLPPGQCRDEGCAERPIHSTDAFNCLLQVAKRAAMENERKLRNLAWAMAQNEADVRKAKEEALLKRKKNSKTDEEKEYTKKLKIEAKAAGSKKITDFFKRPA